MPIGQEIIRESFCAEETFAFGLELGREAKGGQVYCLDGDLGAGKTVFAQGFAKGLGVAGPVASPTFTIIHEYDDGRLPFYHFDVYRIGDVSEMDEVGYEDYFYGGGVCLVEWSVLVAEVLPGDAVHINIEKDVAQGLSYRRILVRGF